MEEPGAARHPTQEDHYGEGVAPIQVPARSGKHVKLLGHPENGSEQKQDGHDSEWKAEMFLGTPLRASSVTARPAHD